MFNLIFFFFFVHRRQYRFSVSLKILSPNYGRPRQQTTLNGYIRLFGRIAIRSFNNNNKLVFAFRPAPSDFVQKRYILFRRKRAH